LQKLLRDANCSIEMTMAYFAPPDELVEQLCHSARSGVRVRLVLPGRSDVWLLRVAAHSFYERLLDAGVEVYERQHAVLHAKTLCVDARISIVGSTNLDYRSIQKNCELSLVVHSKPFAAHLHELFEHDVGSRAGSWRRSGVAARARTPWCNVRSC
jgi:cardiolipin synthase